MSSLRRIARDIRRWASETGLEWWVELVTTEFKFTEAYGFTLEEVHLHFLGNYVRYLSPEYDLSINYEPESTRTIEATLAPRTEGEPSPVLLETLFQDHGLGLTPLAKTPLTRSVVTENVRFWATGLRQIADELF